MNNNDADDVYEAPLSLLQLKEKVQQFVDGTDESARIARKSRDYYDGKQISPHVKEMLRKRGQPDIKINRIRPLVLGVLGSIDAGANDPEAVGRNFTDQDSADAVSKLLRFVCDKGNWKKRRKQVSENWGIQGTGAAVYGWDDDRQALTMDNIPWSEFVYDPYSIELDFEDARFLGIAKMLDRDQVSATYPAFDRLGAPDGELSEMAFFDQDDSPRYRTWWGAGKRRQVRVVDLYYQAPNGEWHRSIFCTAGILFAGPSDYHNDENESICPIVGSSYEIDRFGMRYGMVKDMIDPQDEINARRSRMLHLVNHRQTQQTEYNVPAANKQIAKDEAAKADGSLPYGFTVIPTQDMVQGQMTVYQESSSDLAALTPSGSASADGESGRSRQILLQQGNVQQSRSLGHFSAWEHQSFTVMWWIIREYMSQPQTVRITDDPRTPGFMTVNDPITQKMPVALTHPETGEHIVNPITGRPHYVEKEVHVGWNNHLAKMDVDILITNVADNITLRQEAFQQISDWASAIKVSPFDPQFISMLEMSGMPNQRETIEKLEAAKAKLDQENAPMQAAQAQAAQEQHQVDLMVKSGKAQKEQAQTALTQAQAEKTSQEVHMNETAMWQQALKNGAVRAAYAPFGQQ